MLPVFASLVCFCYCSVFSFRIVWLVNGASLPLKRVLSPFLVDVTCSLFAVVFVVLKVIYLTRLVSFCLTQSRFIFCENHPSSWASSFSYDSVLSEGVSCVCVCVTSVTTSFLL